MPAYPQVRGHPWVITRPLKKLMGLRPGPLSSRGGDGVLHDLTSRVDRRTGRAPRSHAAGDLVSRNGGDEFIILIHAFTDKRRLNLLRAGIIESVLKPIRVDSGEETNVGVSLGVAQAPLSGITGSALMRAPDEALYAAKP